MVDSFHTRLKLKNLLVLVFVVFQVALLVYPQADCFLHYGGFGTVFFFLLFHSNRDAARKNDRLKSEFIVLFEIS